MRSILITVILSTMVFSNSMSGWNSANEEEAAKAEAAEQARMCQVYTDKIAQYKKTMRHDEMAQATLNNYVRLQTKFCTQTHS